jgi:hypothetical protein
MGSKVATIWFASAMPVDPLKGRPFRVKPSEKSEGSGRLLAGLTGRIVRKHDIAKGWVYIRLDPNDRVPQLAWSIYLERLELL